MCHKSFTGECDFQWIDVLSNAILKDSYPSCAVFWFNLTQRVYAFIVEVSNGLIHLNLIFLVQIVFGKSVTGGVWIF